MHWAKSGDVTLMVILGGGLISFFGPILGATVFIFLRDLFSTVTQHWVLIYGLLFMFVIVFLPEGLLSIFKGEDRKFEIPWFQK
jgi:branched-chain amino acid transport system permease protein